MGKLDLAKLKAEVDKEMSKMKTPNAAAKLQAAFNSKDLGPENYKEFGQILYDVAAKDPEGFKEKGYVLFDKMIRPRNGAKLADFEKFFVENFCKLPGEEFAVVLDGSIESHKSVNKGNIFVSNLRIIATGVQEAKKAQVSGGFLDFIALGSYLYNKSIMEQIMASVGGQGSMINFGVVYPIKDCYDVEQTTKGFGVKNPNVIKFKVDVTFKNKKGQDETSALEFSIFPNLDWKTSTMADTLGKIEEALKAVAKA